jgi:signal transduction histidine kinase/ActR/RegA family two-component response regulator
MELQETERFAKSARAAPTKAQILLIEADADAAARNAGLLQANGYPVAVVTNAGAAIDWLDNIATLAVVVAPLAVLDFNGAPSAKTAKSERRNSIALAIAVSPADPLQSPGLSARAVVLEPYNPDTLIAGIERARSLGAGRLDRLAPLVNLGSIALSVAHEINNVLTYLIGNLDTIQEQIDREGSSRSALLEPAREARYATNRVVTIVKQIQAGYLPAAEGAAEADISTAIEHASNIAAHKLRSCQLTTELEDIPSARMDQAQLEQVLVNLLLNAADAVSARESPTSPEIRVGAAVRGALVNIWVSDTGTGIAPAVQPRIFEPFFTTGKGSSGTGVGLWLSRSLVRAAGGELTFESTPGRGTTFRIELPPASAPGLRLVGRQAHPQKPLEQHFPVVQPAVPSDQEHLVSGVLIVEQFDHVRDMLANLLRRHGHEALTASDAEEARRILGNVVPDLIVTSLALGKTNGADFLAALQRQPTLAGIPSIVMTGSPRAEAERCLRAAGVSSVILVKPFRLRSFLQVVKEHLPGSATAKPRGS